MASALYDPAEHRPLDGGAWSEARARAAIEQIAGDAIAAYRGPERLWPNAPDDLEGAPDVPMRGAYLGAAGVAWALQALAADGLAPRLARIDELAEALPDGYRAAPDLPHLADAPAPSLLFGESGVLLAVEAIRRDGGQLDRLHAVIAANARNPALELCWGSPGTLLAALALWNGTGELRFRDAWLDSAAWLLDRWTEDVWVQDLYGERSRYTGAGHGFAGNAGALLSGADLLGAGAAQVADRVVRTLRRLATGDDRVMQWPPLLGVRDGRAPVQWCHGAPGVVTMLAPVLEPDPETDRLLGAGAELSWRAGPLRKSPGLCHGTAGNAYALLAMWERSGSELWIERARALAMDAIADVARRREAAGRGRYTLFTGDLGVAMLLRGLLLGDPVFPFVDAELLSVGAPPTGPDAPPTGPDAPPTGPDASTRMSAAADRE